MCSKTCCFYKGGNCILINLDTKSIYRCPLQQLKIFLHYSPVSLPSIKQFKLEIKDHNISTHSFSYLSLTILYSASTIFQHTVNRMMYGLNLAKKTPPTTINLNSYKGIEIFTKASCDLYLS